MKFKNLIVLGAIFGLLSSCSYQNEEAAEALEAAIQAEEINLIEKEEEWCERFGEEMAFDLKLEGVSQTPIGTPVNANLDYLIDYQETEEYYFGEHCMCNVGSFVFVFDYDGTQLSQPIAFTAGMQEIAVDTPYLDQDPNGNWKWFVECTGYFGGQVYLGWDVGATNTSALQKASGLCVIDNISGPRGNTAAQTWVWKHAYKNERGQDVIDAYLPPSAVTATHWLLP